MYHKSGLLIICFAAVSPFLYCAKPVSQKTDSIKSDMQKTTIEAAPSQAGAAAAGPSVASNSNPLDESFPLIKKYIEGSPYRIVDWKIAAENQEYVSDCTMCHVSAAAIIHALTGETDDAEKYFDFDDIFFKLAIAQRDKQMNDKKKALSQQEFIGTFDELISKKSPIAQKLFMPSTTPEHLVFYITFKKYYKAKPTEIELDHSFVVEKFKDKWRIYQSNINAFTLAQWLGIDPWDKAIILKGTNKEGADNFTHMFQTLGKGKQLSQKEFEQFMHDIIAANRPNMKFMADEHGKVAIYVKFFEGNIKNISEALEKQK